MKPINNSSTFALFIASMGNLGYAFPAAGTVGSLATMPFIIVIAYFYGFLGLLVASIILLIVALISVGSALLSTKQQDPNFIIIDEAVGQCVTFLTIGQALQGNLSIKVFFIYIMGFALFRLFDIWKPYPVSYFDEKVQGSIGVVLDDVCAGIYASLFLNVIYLLFP
ncbi:Phosphatidylglycerophosphatase A [Candidatus Hepatincola sp. Av]